MSDTSYAHLILQKNLSALAITKAAEAIKNTGRALPCSVIAVMNGLVSVKFEVQQILDTSTDPPTQLTLPPVIIPKAESQWLRAPTQVGDLGMVMPADTSLGGVSGPGSVADLSNDYGNLTSLVFVPVTNTSWVEAPDPNKAWVNGPNGAIVSDTAMKRIIDVDSDPAITMTVLEAAGTGATSVVSKLDGAANSITHELTGSLGTMKTIVDGNGNAISHIVPTGGGLGLGALFGSMSSAESAYNETHITDLMTNLKVSRAQDMSTMAAAIAAAVPGGGAIIAELEALSSLPSLLTLASALFPLPTIPAGAAKVRLPT